MTVKDKLKSYTPEQLVSAAETTQELIGDPTTSAYDRSTFRQLLNTIEDEMRRRLAP